MCRILLNIQLIYWFYKVSFLHARGRWFVWNKAPDHIVRVVGTVLYRETRADSDVVAYLCSEARSDWKFRKRFKRSRARLLR